MALRIALAQIDATVGDLAGNAAIALEAVREAGRAGAELVLLPEMALTGYPIEDLALHRSFQDAAEQATADLAAALAREGLGGIAVVAGTLARSASGGPVNAAAVLHDGRVIATYAKHHLPNYGVFDEARTFVRGEAPVHLRLDGTTVTLAVCEDLWQDGGPVRWAREAGAGLLAVVNASPYEAGKLDRRLALARERAAEARCALAYVNLVGGQDELVFDGGSLLVDRDGDLLARAPQFAPCVLVADLELPSAPAPVGAIAITSRAPAGPAAVTATVAPELDPLEETYGALLLGLADYVRKNGFGGVVLGLSGGIDSALVAALACDALGPDHVTGVSMPSAYSSAHSRDDAAELAERTGLRFRTVPIAPMVDAYQSALELSGLAEENLQARVRGTLLMGIANNEGLLLLTTGNKSELSVGYSTLYGDSAGGFAPIKDVPKTLVWALARWRNARAAERGEVPPIPESSITKPPSAELRPGQLDTDSLPDYEVLDAILDAYVGRDEGAAALVAAGFDRALVDRVLALVDAAEHKRRQSAPGTKISLRAFGRDRRVPITSAWRERSGS